MRVTSASFLFLGIGNLLSAVMHPADAQFQFVEVGGQSGFVEFTMESGTGGGVAAADFDDDGDIDLFVPNANAVPDQLYRNMGNGQFEEIASGAGVASLESSRAALWFDYDGDSQLDLVVAGDECMERMSGEGEGEGESPGGEGEEEGCFLTIRLYRQVSEAVFEDVTEESQIIDAIGMADDLVAYLLGGMAAGDINNDGYLDLAISVWSERAFLLLNNGNGVFSGITNSSGIGGGNIHPWQHLMHDFNGDGWLDIYTAVDFRANHLWINQGNNTFVDVAPSAGVDNDWSDMGAALGDYDNDGDMDIYVTNITLGSSHGILYRNDSVGEALQFAEVSEAAGVAEIGYGWGCTFFDADNDGYLDLAVTNGFAGREHESKLFLNLGGNPVTFADVSNDVGFDDIFWGSSLIAIDYNRDGFLDMVQTVQGFLDKPSRLRLLKNLPGEQTQANNFLVIKPRMEGPNYRAIGALVRARVGEVTMTRLITAGTSYIGQEPAEAHFGLGSAPQADEVVIEWPDGTESVLENVPANQVLIVDNLAVANEGEAEGDESPDSEMMGEGEAELDGSEGSEGEVQLEDAESGERETEGEDDSPNSPNTSASYSPQAAMAASVHSLDGIRICRDQFLTGTQTGVPLTAVYYSRQTEESIRLALASPAEVTLVENTIYAPLVLLLRSPHPVNVFLIACLLAALWIVARQLAARSEP